MCFQRVRCCKTATFDNFCAISRATALEHHSANQFLKAQQTSMLSSRNCFKLLVKMISTSPIAGCPSFKFLTMQMQPSASCTRMWTVLSATIMFADKPHRLNERTSAQRFCVLTILPPVPHSRLGYPRSGLTRSDFVLAQMRRADCIEQCPLSGVTRKTFAHSEFFSVLTRMYGPAVRCKWFRRAGGERSCINVSGLRLVHLLRAIMDISARATSLPDRPRLD